MTIRENIIRLREIFGITQDQLAKIAGVTRGAVSQWEGGFSEPRMGAIQNMASYFGIRKSNIIEDGGMDSIDPITKKPKIPNNAKKMVAGKRATMPLLGRVHAGKPVEPDAIEGEVVVPESIKLLHPKGYCLEVEGDCMDRVYPEGCIIVVDPNLEPSNGSIAAVMIDGNEAVMRRLYRGATTMVLSPESYNPNHEDIVITQHDERVVELVGTVVWFQSNGEMR